MLMLMGQFAIDPQTRGAFMVFVKGMIQRQQAQPGCIDIGIFEDVTHLNTFLMVEQWENYEAFNRFGATQIFEHDEDVLNEFAVGGVSYDEYEFDVPPEVN